MKNKTKANICLSIFLAIILILNSACESSDVENQSENITVWITLINNNKVVSGEALIAAKSHTGELLWSATKPVKDSATIIKLKENADYYSFTFTANAAVKHLSISQTNLKANPSLIVGLTEADYFKYTTSDGNVTVLFPKDPTNPYCEVKVIDPSKIVYGYFSRSFWLNNQPVEHELYRSFVPDGVDNVTFKPFVKFNGQHGSTWNRSYGMIIYLSTENVYEDIERAWEF